VALVSVTDHAVERYLQRVRGALDPRPEIAGRVRRAWEAGRVGEGEFAAIAGDAFAAAEGRYPQLASALRRLRRAVHARLVGSTVPLVWQHGDYKLENLIFDERSREPAAVIDWELAAPAGLPLLDLYYLLIYRRITRGEASDVLELVSEMAAGRWQSAEAEMIALYAREVAVPAELSTACIAVFLVHHIGIRFAYDPDDTLARERMTSAVDVVTSELERNEPLRAIS